MPPLPKLLKRCLVVALWALLLTGPLNLLGVAISAHAASGDTMGRVSRVQGQVLASFEGVTRPLALQDKVLTGDLLRTGKDARLEITVTDNTVLTLSGDTEFSVERYDLGRQQGAGAVLLKLTKGAFRVATGQLSSLRGGPFEVSTPLATVGIRGTEFWGGYLTATEISVLLLAGKGVYIKNDAGTSEILRPGEGVTVGSRSEVPPEPFLWSPARKAQALKTVAFD